jgi:uncharacterized membrane protein
MRKKIKAAVLSNQTTAVIHETLPQVKTRIQSIDILRGTVMLIMALDHARDYFHLHAWDDSPTNLATTTPALFFTRWITHFCAPTFVFLSGISAFLSGQKKSKKELSAFLLKRGLWLVLVEIVVITLGWTFNPLYNVIILQVIWAIGWSMIVLGLLVRTNMTVIIITGCILFFGHNILDYVDLPKEGAANVAWNIFFTSPLTFFSYAPQRVIGDIYAILPWTSVMLLGYGFGYFYRSSYDALKRKKILLWGGIGITALFIVLRFINHYGDPALWSQQKDGAYTFLSFLNTTKYPPSLIYFCMTLGPTLILLSFTERPQNKFSNILTTYGRVPFFYYVIHLYLLHFIGVIFFFASGYGFNQAVDTNVPFLFRPTHFGFDLWGVYAVWLFVIVILYWPCKWFNRYKTNHHQWWLSYV